MNLQGPRRDDSRLHRVDLDLDELLAPPEQCRSCGAVLVVAEGHRGRAWCPRCTVPAQRQGGPVLTSQPERRPAGEPANEVPG